MSSLAPVDPATAAAASRHSKAEVLRGPVVIEVRDVEKTFRVPSHRIDSFKERAVHPFTRAQYRELHAVRPLSFEVHRGEFFGIVGRNGSGKSTLLKMLASIYRADAGRIRIGGRLAPFIELGVGFNPDLTAQDNIVLNAVMMGLSKREARARVDAVLDFAELGEFGEMRLKNYSSGMMVRLAFAVMVQADADIMLVDEVLAVGDAAFAQRCVDVFRAKREAGRTIVLVTHDMATVQAFCDRAMLIHDGDLLYIGDPEEAAMRYFRLNFSGIGDYDVPREGGVPDVHARPIDSWLENEAGERVENFEQGQPIGFGLVVEARRELTGPVFGFHFMDVHGNTVFGVNQTVTGGDPDRIRAGERVRITGRLENPLLPGRYFVNCWVCRNRNQGDVALQIMRLFDFVVYGTQPGPGTVSVQAEIEAVVEEAPGS
jgi:ABC-type polysaccharide/polyol phosphate transport system ATPase subunit